MRERRAKFAGDPEAVLNMLREGSDKAQATAQATMREVREAMGIQYFKQVLLDLHVTQTTGLVLHLQLSNLFCILVKDIQVRKDHITFNVTRIFDANVLWISVH